MLCELENNQTTTTKLMRNEGELFKLYDLEEYGDVTYCCIDNRLYVVTEWLDSKNANYYEITLDQLRMAFDKYKILCGSTIDKETVKKVEKILNNSEVFIENDQKNIEKAINIRIKELGVYFSELKRLNLPNEYTILRNGNKVKEKIRL